MLCTGEEQLKKQLEAPGGKAWFLYGSENYLIEKYAAKLTARFGGGLGAFNLQRFDGKKPDMDAVWGAVEALPLMAPEKCVVLDDLDVAKLPAGELQKLEDMLADLPEDCTLLITAKAPGFDARSAAGKKLIKAADNAGFAAQLNAPLPTELQSFVKARVKHGGCAISTEVARYLLSVCSNDMGVLTHEIAKLCAYAGGGDISERQIDEVAIAKTEAKVFDLSKAILSGNVQKALEILDALFYIREQAVAILAVLAMSFTDLYRARVAKDAGKTPADVVALFGYKGKEFRVTNAFASCSKLPAATLRQMLAVLYSCDRDLKSTVVDDRVLLERAVVRLFALAGAR